MARHSFALESLEGRTLFSSVAPSLAAPVATGASLASYQVAAASVSPLAGAFNVAGTYVHQIGHIGNPDAGAPYQFTGLGKTKSLGLFTVTGYVRTPGLIANGRSSGKLVLTSSHGTITLYLHGPAQTPGVLPTFMSYTIGRGTGAYLNSTGKGLFALGYSANTYKFLFRFNQVT